ncbi:Uncharacterised protein [Mycobacteroides abscessus]|nr:Uncharacterised protein [Mycobacteroides abscessus]SHY46234.1 Uncharacterised protein [Mycobacteroides abscessus subsp. abscessus]CPS74857.1 Uncharacterised protein [Mycobacteroides abscessus]CPY35871.1 Uncharacterised protein [Mycobacteroides abscessus]CPY84987.1 Uncharacterised protein [Mycobacteroides abscessus]
MRCLYFGKKNILHNACRCLRCLLREAEAISTFKLPTYCLTFLKSNERILLAT